MSGARFTLDPNASRKVLDAAEAAVKDATEFLAQAANETVPHEIGTLELSAQASTDGLKGAVSYDTPYAARQHEDTRLRHKGKGRAKWLQRTLDEKAPRITTFIGEAMRRVIP